MPLLDGTWSVIGNEVILEGGPKLTIDLLVDLAERLAQLSKKEDLTEEEIREEVDSITSRGVYDNLKKEIAKSPLASAAAIVAVLAFVVQLAKCSTDFSDKPAEINQVYEQRTENIRNEYNVEIKPTTNIYLPYSKENIAKEAQRAVEQYMLEQKLAKQNAQTK